MMVVAYNGYRLPSGYFSVCWGPVFRGFIFSGRIDGASERIGLVVGLQNNNSFNGYNVEIRIVAFDIRSNLIMED
jgi:hypothetical protein